MMKLIRKILGVIILFLDRVTAPKLLVRPTEVQAKIDEETSALSLYEFRTCPFCVKVRREIRRLGLKIPLRDAQSPGPDRDALEREGGKIQVPCLKITGGVRDRWLYESDDIIAYLRQRFGRVDA